MMIKMQITFENNATEARAIKNNTDHFFTWRNSYQQKHSLKPHLIIKQVSNAH